MIVNINYRDVPGIFKKKRNEIIFISINVVEVGVSAPFEKRKRTVFGNPGTVPWNGSKGADSRSELPSPTECLPFLQSSSFSEAKQRHKNQGWNF